MVVRARTPRDRKAAQAGKLVARRGDAAVAQGAFRAGGGGASRSASTRRPARGGRALLERSFIFEGTFGDNPKLLEALEIAEKAAPTDLPVLIDGESGTGKELMAKVIHANGSRARQAVHLRQLRRDSRQSAGVRTVRAQEGRVHGRVERPQGQVRKRAYGHDLSRRDRRIAAAGQVKLLRVLEAHEIQRVGSDETDRGRHAHRRGDQPQPAAAQRAGQVPRRPVLPAQRDSPDAAAAARAPRRDSAAARLFRRRSGRHAEAPAGES